MNKLDKIKIIDDFIKGSKNRLRENYFLKYNLELYNQIIEFTSNIDLKFKQRIWHWVNEQSDYIYCEECKINRVSAKMNWKDGYKKFCSNKCSSNNQELRDNTKKTLKEKYGVEHYSKTKEYVQKVKNTSLDRYGVDNYSKTDEYVIKSKNTYLQKYGVDSYTKTEEYVKKSKETCLEKYGVDSYIKTEEYKNKYKNTCLNKYGVEHIYKSELWRNNFKMCNNENYIKYIGNKCSLLECEKGHTFEINTDNYYGRIKNSINLCTICNPIGEQRSIKENELYDFIKEIYNDTIIKSFRDNLEIDVYLPDLKIGFEFNGLYYHSDKYKDKNYHLNKSKFFEEKGIRIIHIWEDDWLYKSDILKSQIRNLLKLNNIIWARNCSIVELSDKKIVRNFLNENHIQGNDRSIKEIGLYYNNELVSIMTFNKSEGRKIMIDNEWNLSRFCNKINTSVIGGASKLLNFFIKKNNVNRIISYADKDWSQGDLYFKLGFNKVHESKPDYKYIVGNVRKHKQNFTKSRLNLDSNITESNYMNKNKIYKIYDCGKIKFEYKNKTQL